MSTCNNAQACMCTDYLLLKPEEASFCDLARLLWSNDTRHFIKSPLDLEEELRAFRYRWLMFISAVMMKLLDYMKKPMAHTGHMLEVWSNLITNNGGMLKLLLNVIKGKVDFPNASSETFRSIVGCMDTRVDLDPGLPIGNANYKAALSLMAAKLSYENSRFIKNVAEHHWKMKLINSYEFQNDNLGRNTHAFMCRTLQEDEDLTVVAFRGTKPFDMEDWCTDFDMSWYGLTGIGRVHCGFMKALGLQIHDDSAGWPNEIDVLDVQKPQFAYYTIRQVLREICHENKNAKFIVTGHSLGGALAILFASVLILHGEEELLDRLEGVYTFGQPRVGDEQFGEFMKKNLKTYNVNYCRYVYCNDMVPRLPYDDKTLLFKHFGPCLYFNSLYKGKEMTEEPNKNYFSLIWMIPKYMNAGWELIRGLIFPYWKWGSDYSEGWCERVYRLIGLVCPGLSAHGLQDYNNITRLGRLSFPGHLNNNPTYDRNRKSK